MMRSGFIRQLAWVALVLMLPMLLVWPAALPADQAQYFYDDLGRLSVAVDGNKNVAVYTYDAVGNLLSVTQSAQGAGSIGIFFISPTSGAVGTPVTIKGFGFSATPSANAVKFNGTSATVSSSTTDTIQTVVPTGAATGTITVTNTNGTATSPQTFTVLTAPTISSVTPNKVAPSATTSVIIVGTSLLTASAVQFSQTGMTVAVMPGITATSIPINLTVASTVPAGSYSFTVTTPSGVVSSGSITVTVGTPAPSFAFSKIASVNIDQVPSGNVLWLPLDEAAGATSFADSSGGANTFTCSGAACPTAGVSGKINTATQYNGTTSYLKKDDPTLGRIAQVVFSEDFSGSLSSYTSDLDSGAAISVVSGEAQIVANQNVYAHLHRNGISLPANFRVSAKIKITDANAGGSWMPAIWVMWGTDGANSMAFGNAYNFSNYISYQRINGTLTTVNGAAGGDTSYHWYRITCNASTVTHEKSDDGSSWTTIATFSRPASWSGAPSYLAFGKGWKDNSGNWPNAEFNNSWTASPGSSGTTYMDNLLLENLDNVLPQNLQTTTDGSYTFEVWAKPQDVPPNNCTVNTNTCAYAVFMRSNVYYTGFYYFYDSTYGVVMYNNGNQQYWLPSQVVSPGAWHHLAQVVDDTNKLFHFYVDGQEVAGSPISYTGNLKVFGTAPYYVGAYIPVGSYWNWFFKGSIDEVRVYNRALTPLEILHDYNLH